MTGICFLFFISSSARSLDNSGPMFAETYAVTNCESSDRTMHIGRTTFSVRTRCPEQVGPVRICSVRTNATCRSGAQKKANSATPCTTKHTTCSPRSIFFKDAILQQKARKKLETDKAPNQSLVLPLTANVVFRLKYTYTLRAMTARTLQNTHIASSIAPGVIGKHPRCNGLSRYFPLHRCWERQRLLLPYPFPATIIQKQQLSSGSRIEIPSRVRTEMRSPSSTGSGRSCSSVPLQLSVFRPIAAHKPSSFSFLTLSCPVKQSVHSWEKLEHKNLAKCRACGHRCTPSNPVRTVDAYTSKKFHRPVFQQFAHFLTSL